MIITAIFCLIIGFAYLLMPQHIHRWWLSLFNKNPTALLLNTRGYRLQRLMGFGLVVASLMLLGSNWVGQKALVIPNNIIFIFGISVAILLMTAILGSILVLLIRPQWWWSGQSKLYEHPQKVAPSAIGLMMWRVFALLILVILVIMVFYALHALVFN